MEAPAGYVAGAGRGAIGFGDAVVDEPRNLSKSGNPGAGDGIKDDDDDATAIDHAGNDNDDDDIHFNMAADEDDLDAARIYLEIEERRNRRTHRPSAPISDNPTSRFADLKRSLASVSNDEWENLQDPGDLTRKNKRTRLLEQMQQRSYAAPDSLIAGSTINLQENLLTESTDFASISNARNQLWGNQLDQLVALAFDPSTHPSATQSLTNEAQIAQIGDAAKTRSLLRNLRKTRPGLSLLWLSSARLEELVGDRKAAIAILDEGCRRLPHHEDMWLENIQIQESSQVGRKHCKSLISQALQYNRNLFKLWLKAVDLEHKADVSARRTVLMKALQQLPNSIGLWEMMIELEALDLDTKPLVSKATELCPEHYPFWQKLVDLSMYPEAKQILEKAHKTLPGKPEIWIAFAKLEEHENSSTCSDEIDKILTKGFAEIAANAELRWPRMKWLESAADLSTLGFPLTAIQIVNKALAADCMDAANTPPPIRDWLDDADHFSTGSPPVARGIYQYIVLRYPHEINAYIDLLEYFRSNNDTDKLNEYYLLAISNNPNESVFPLMYAKDMWLRQKDVPKAREVLAEAYERLDHKHEIFQARIKLELRTNNPELAHSIYIQRPSEDPKVHHQLLHLERHLLLRGSELVSKKTIEMRSHASRTKFPASRELLLQWAQIQRDELQDSAAARETARRGVVETPDFVPLWLLLVECDAAVGSAMKARTTLDRALAQCPDSDEVWCSKVEFEMAVGEPNAARQWAERAVQRFPASPKVWLRHLRLISKLSHRRKAFVDALKATNNAAEIFLYIGVSLWKDKQYQKAQQWVERALGADRVNGDCWAWLTICSNELGHDHERAKMTEEFGKNMDDIARGDNWLKIANNPGNLCKSPHEILEMVVNEVKTSMS